MSILAFITRLMKRNMCTFCGVTDSIFLLTTELMQAEVISNNVHFFLILIFMSRYKQDMSVDN